MQLTIDLPAHLASAFVGEDEAREWIISCVTDYARSQAVSVASESAASIIRDASAPFDGPGAPTNKTVTERVTDTEVDQVALRTQVRSIGVALAVAAGVSHDDAVNLIEDALSAE